MDSHQSELSFNTTDELAVNTIRVISAEMVQKANSGHPGMPMGFANPAHFLWTRCLRYSPDHPYWSGRDRFLLSGGHGSALLYTLLHLAGYDLSKDDLLQFRQWGSRTPGHPEHGLTPGVETTSGPLGQGVGNAVGLAMAQRYIKGRLGIVDKEGFDPLDHWVFVVAGDGDLQEGVASEAASLAGLQKLGRLVLLYDDNNITIDGSTDISFTEDVMARFEAYGWHVQTVEGNDSEGVVTAIDNAKIETVKPSFISINTHIGHGSPAKQDSSSAHGAPLGEEELEATKKALNWSYPPFHIPEEVYSLYANAADKGRQEYAEWQENLEEWLLVDKERAMLWFELLKGKEPGDWGKSLPEFEPGKSVSTREASGKALNAIAGNYPSLVGGCADLKGSVKTEIVGEEAFLPDIPNGRNIYFGVREHGMGAISNGMALYGGLRPYTGTFLIFSEYMRPAIRMAAMMKLPVIFVFSHDSIGVGEDGPTHQPVEQYASLRAIPNLWVFRPGDANEMTEAWRAAIERTDGPTAILSTRQGLPVIDRTKFGKASGLRQGGYIVADCDGTPELILMATGSELYLVMEAWHILTDQGVKARVVSLPCWELFDLQDYDYRESVLPSNVKARIAVEAGISMGWKRFIGDAGKMISMESYGESAPANILFEEFGFTVDNIIELANKYFK
ncbi:MAG: transketolase [Candidatus Electryonea clarkiae]|nr:transketolase [Candidatus Electryonea clarkiae]MDP8288919.1 transketolase [Candidatus Electryonea clarkiae]